MVRTKLRYRYYDKNVILHQRQNSLVLLIIKGNKKCWVELKKELLGLS